MAQPEHRIREQTAKALKVRRRKRERLPSLLFGLRHKWSLQKLWTPYTSFPLKNAATVMVVPFHSTSFCHSRDRTFSPKAMIVASKAKRTEHFKRSVK